MNEKFDAAIRRFDEENSRDPHLENSRPRELLKAPGWLHEVAAANE